MRAYLRLNWKEHLEAAIAKMEQDGFIPKGLKLPPDAEAALFAVVESQIGGPHWQAMVGGFEEGLRRAIDYRKAARRAHVAALSKMATSEVHPSELASLEWDVLTTARGGVILGDVAVVCRRNPDSSIVPGVLRQSVDDVLIAPIAHDLILVQRHADPLLDLTPEALCVGIAETSREYFISIEASSLEARLHGQVGTRAVLITEGEAARNMQAAFVGLTTAKSPPPMNE